MSAVLPVGDVSALTAGRIGLAQGRSSADVPASSRTGSAPNPESDEPVGNVATEAAQVAIDQARLAEWAERVRTADKPSAPLVQRPVPDGDRPGYPTAVQAYREMSELIDEL